VQLARRRIGQNLRPDRLGLAHDHGIGVLKRLLWKHGRMNAAKDHGFARAAVGVRDLVGPSGLDGHGRDADQIGLVSAIPTVSPRCSWTMETSCSAGVIAASS
jgi:hypothetical protein